jgi:hypothetical protein
MKRTTKAKTRVIANRTWRVDHGAIDAHLMYLAVSGERPAWALDLASLFAEIADGIEAGSPDARVWAIAQLRTVAEAFDPQ